MRSTQLTGRLRRRSRPILVTLVLFSILALALSWMAAPGANRVTSEPFDEGALQSVTERPAAIEGWIKVEGSSQALEGATVALSGRVVATSNADGYFRVSPEAFADLAGDGSRQVTLSVSARGFAPWTIRDAIYRDGDTLRLYPRLSGAVTTVKAHKLGVERSRGYNVSLLSDYRQRYALPGAFALAQTLTPPSTIRIYRTRSATVEVVPFRDYLKHVLPNEWVPSWSPEALKAGAMAVKTYAWYWVRLGGKQVALGADLKDNVEDQVYDPNVSYASTDAAVDATFNYVMTRNGALFQAQYCAGSYEANPEGDCPWPGSRYMTQWGSAYHADQGRGWGWILQFYYGATITPKPPGPGYSGEPPVSNPTSAPPRQPAQPTATLAPQQYVVGQGSNRPEVFREAFERNGGEAVLGKPVGPVRWWMQYVSEANVLSQRFSGPLGHNNMWIIYDVLASERNLKERAFVLAGDIGAAYVDHQPPGPEWIGAPSSDPYIDASGRPSQGFTRGTLQHNGQGIVFVPWPAELEGWRAEYFPGEMEPASPVRDMAGRPSLVRKVDTPNLDWPASQGTAQSTGVGRGAWAAQFTEELSFDGTLQEFILNANGPATLWVDGSLVVNGLDWSGMAVGMGKWSAALSAGKHVVRVQYFNGGGDAKLNLVIKAKEASPPTPAPIPGIATSGPLAKLKVAVRWLGGGKTAPDASWVRAVTLHLSDPQSHARLFTVQGRTDEFGVATFEGLAPGRYNVHVKGPHSLQSAVAGVELVGGETLSLDMGAQVEGDVDGDNCVTVDDFMRVQVMLGAHASIPGFDPGADLDGDGLVTMKDISLLRSGFDLCGDLPASGEARITTEAGEVSLRQHLIPWTDTQNLQRTLGLALTTPRNTARVGEVVEVKVIARAGSQPVDGASFLLRYDPKRLAPVDAAGREATDVEPGIALPAVMGNWIDRAGGAIGYSAGSLQGTLPQGEFTVATLRFRLLPGAAGPTEVRFAPLQSGYLQLTNGGANLLASSGNLTLTVQP